jgi:hypothetical protein
MFKREKVGVRIANINPELMEKDDAEIALVRLSCEISPLTAELAQELHDFVRGTLYTLSGAEVNSLLGGASFALAIPPQAIAVRMAPDQKKPSFTIDEAKIAGLHAKRSKKSTAWTLGFTITCAPASEHQLAQIMESYCKTKYMSFGPAEPGLFDEVPTPTKGRGLSANETESTEEEPELPVEDAEEEATAH